MCESRVTEACEPKGKGIYVSTKVLSPNDLAYATAILTHDMHVCMSIIQLHARKLLVYGSKPTIP